MNKIYIIELESEFVLKKRGDSILPIEKIKKKLVEKFNNDIEFIGDSFTTLYYKINESNINVDEVKRFVEAILKKEYKEKNPSEVVNFSEEVIKEEPKKEEKPFDEEKASEQTLAPSEDKVEEITKSIDSLVGGDQFKDFIEEVKTIAPTIVKNKTNKSFFYQSYIFSIDDGCGIENFVRLFGELVDSLGIGRLYRNHPFVNEVVPAPTNAYYSQWISELSDKLNGDPSGFRVICFDISECLDYLKDSRFKEFLLLINRYYQSNIYIFRVPFIEKGVLEKVFFALNDLAYIRVITFPPLTNDDIKKWATRIINEYGFSVDEEAWSYFFERVKEEKSDGRFYGITTIEKITNELIYKKQLDNAKNNSDDKKITKENTKEICFLDQGDDISGYEMLERLVGCEPIKKQIDSIIAQFELARSSAELDTPCIHMRFVGNPGTGKTTVARIIGKIFKERGILRIGDFYEYQARDFCGQYVGHTAPRTARICRDAYGSVLFIDEAYAFYQSDDNGRDFGKEALDALIAEMENHRSDFVVIMAGYTDDMEKMLKGNAGLASRMPYTINFPNFTRDELYKIFVLLLGKKFEYTDDFLPAVRDYFSQLPDNLINAKEFSNGRFVRNLFERTWSKAAIRVQLEKGKKIALSKEDFLKATFDHEFNLNAPSSAKSKKIGFLG